MLVDSNPLLINNENMESDQFDFDFLAQTNLTLFFNDSSFQCFTDVSTRNVPNFTMEMSTGISPWMLSQADEVVSPLVLSNDSPIDSYFPISHKPNHNIKSALPYLNPPPVDPKFAAETARQRNRMASRICRKRKQKETKLVQLSLQTIKESNRLLEAQIDSLSQELNVIRELLWTSCNLSTY